ncbi:MAG: serine hydrolase [Candidatus Paceibacterota bacterium]
MIKHKFLFWSSFAVISLGAIIGFQNQEPLKDSPVQAKKSTLDYVIPAIENNPIVKSIEAIDFGFNTSSPIVKTDPVQTPPRTTISALAYGTYFVNSDGTVKNLLGQNLDKPLGIASITKLMTALIAVKSMNPNDEVIITEKDFGKGTFDRYKVGDKLTIQNILYSLLIESDNDAARIIENHYGADNFILAMNNEAKSLGMVNTKYFNSSGVDGETPSEDNVSTVSDLTKLTEYIELKYPSIFAITSISKYDIVDVSGKFHHEAISTDKLIDEFSVNYFVGGKTGFTTRAKQNLLILRAHDGDDGYYIDTVLSSDDRFGDMKLLISKIPN